MSGSILPGFPGRGVPQVQVQLLPIFEVKSVLASLPIDPGDELGCLAELEKRFQALMDQGFSIASAQQLSPGVILYQLTRVKGFRQIEVGIAFTPDAGDPDRRRS